MHQIIANNGRHALGVGKIRRNIAELTLACKQSNLPHDI